MHRHICTSLLIALLGFSGMSCATMDKAVGAYQRLLDTTPRRPERMSTFFRPSLHYVVNGVHHQGSYIKVKPNQRVDIVVGTDDRWNARQIRWSYEGGRQHGSRSGCGREGMRFGIRACGNYALTIDVVYEDGYGALVGTDPDNTYTVDATAFDPRHPWQH